MNETSKRKSRRNREEKSTRVETLLNGLTVDQVRSVFLHLKREIPKGRKTFEDLTNSVLECGSSLNDIIDAVHAVESSIAQKHFYLAEWVGSVPKTFESSVSYGSDVCPNLKKLKLSYVRRESDHVRLVFEHQVLVEELKEQDDGETFKRVRHQLRHPIFVRIYPSSQIAYVMYPGFSQGRTTKKKRISYKDMVSDVLSAMQKSFRWKFSVVPFRTAVDLLSDMESKRVSRIKVTPASVNGRLSVTTRADGQSVEEYLASFVGHGLPASEAQNIRNAIKKALSASPMDQIVAYWTQEKLVTRIEFWSTGAEFYFIWHRTEQNFAICARIFDLLRLVLANLANHSPLVDLIKTSKVGDIISPNDLINRVGGTPEEVRTALLSAAQSGLIEPIYRLRTEALISDYENVWTQNLGELARRFETESGAIDGEDPANIEIAFTRAIIKNELQAARA